MVHSTQAKSVIPTQANLQKNKSLYVPSLRKPLRQSMPSLKSKKQIMKTHSDVKRSTAHYADTSSLWNTLNSKP